MVTGILPQTASFDIKRTTKGMCKFRYSETIDPRSKPQREGLKNLRETLKGLEIAGMKIKASGTSVTIEGTASVNRVAGMIAGEFLAWTSLGSTTLHDLLVAAGASAVFAATAAKAANEDARRDARREWRQARGTWKRQGKRRAGAAGGEPK